MTPKQQLTTGKRVQISKANATMIGVIAGAVFITVFSLVASRSLLTKRNFQSRVITQKEKARDQLISNLKTVEGLKVSYAEFVGAPDNVLGGNPAGTGEKDGDNAKLVLDALPSKYDYPALVTSLEKILTDKKFKIDSIRGKDDEIKQEKNSTSNDPKPVDMPFEFSVSGSYSTIQELIGVFEHSVRPFQIQGLSFTANDEALQINVKAKTFFQPEKSLQIKTKEVK